jgi:Fe-S cluster assembly iron-binding protein IscA
MEEKIYNISVSPKAAEQIKNQLIKRGTPESYLRLGVKGGGSSGFSYVIQFEDTPPREKDLLFLCIAYTNLSNARNSVAIS